MQTSRLHSILAVALGLCPLWLTSPARAADRFWTNAVGGGFSGLFNWFNHLSPFATDNAHFTNHASYRVFWR